MSMYLAFVANNNSNRLLVSHSGNGKNWAPSTQVGSESSKRAPAAAFVSSGPQGFTLGFVANNASNQLLVSHSADGVHWNPNTQVQNQSSKAAPALAVFDSKLWIAFVANDASNQLLVSHSADGLTWSPSTKVQNQTSNAKPALAVFDSKLWIAFVANNASKQLLVSHSAHGHNWSPSTEVQNQSSKAAPALLGL
ncbi:MAG TPA: hypothetical protein VH642_02320 [Streptosporangiaceae bacterium]